MRTQRTRLLSPIAAAALALGLALGGPVIARTAEAAPVGPLQPAPPKPDLKPAFAPTGWSLPKGAKFEIKVTLQNVGQATAAPARLRVKVPYGVGLAFPQPAGFDCAWWMAQSDSNKTWISCDTPSLAAGAAVGRTIVAYAPKAAGTFVIEASADPELEVAESNESNNSAKAVLQVVP